jgi:hypothetical protein
MCTAWVSAGGIVVEHLYDEPAVPGQRGRRFSTAGVPLSLVRTPSSGWTSWPWTPRAWRSRSPARGRRWRPALRVPTAGPAARPPPAPVRRAPIEGSCRRLDRRRYLASSSSDRASCASHALSEPCRKVSFLRRCSWPSSRIRSSSGGATPPYAYGEEADRHLVHQASSAARMPSAGVPTSTQPKGG